MKNVIQDAKVSSTIQFGLLLQLAAVAQTYVETLGNPLFTMIIGMVIIVLRYKTTQSVEEKKNAG